MSLVKERPGLAVLYVVLALLFFAASILQINDIDPAVYYRPSLADASAWVLFYALIAGLFLLALFRPAPRVLLGLAGAFCLWQMLRSGPGLYQNLTGGEAFTMAGSSMNPVHAEVELSREFFGALMALGAVVLLWRQGARYRSRTGGVDRDESEEAARS